MARIPSPVIAEIARAFESEYTHGDIDNLFMRSGALGDPPPGSKLRKVTEWLRQIDADPAADALAVLGKLLEDFLERQPPYHLTYAGNEGPAEGWHDRRKRVRDAMVARGLSYQTGGKIIGGTLHAPSKSLADHLRDRDLPAVHSEFDRALANVETDPAAAITAASSILESTCRAYIAEEGLTPPAEGSLHPLWKVVQAHLQLSPAATNDADFRKVLGGLASIVDGVGALRTHAGSAHGHDPKTVAVEARHARLAAHAAHTVVTFVLETWPTRKP